MTAPSVYPAGIDAVAARAKQAMLAHLFDAPASAESFERDVLASRQQRRRAAALWRSNAPRRKKHAAPPVAPPAEPSPYQTAVSAIVSSVRSAIVAPLLRSESVEQFNDIVSGHFAEFANAMDAIRTVRRATGTAPPADHAFMEKYYEHIGKLVAPEAEDELRFDVGTIDRAAKLVARLREFGPTNSAAEAALANDFQVNVVVHTLGVVALMEVCCNTEHTQVAIEQCFELTRGGSLRAYAAVRQALDLRRPARPPVEMGTGEDIA